MSLDYQARGALHPDKPFNWRAVIISILIVGGIIVFFCSGLPFPILSGASHDLGDKLANDFGIGLPRSAIVDRGARMAERDVSYFFLVHMTPADLQSFISTLRSKATAGWISDRDRFDIVGTGPPAWFNTTGISDLTTFDIDIRADHTWRVGYSPSTGKLFVYWMSF